ncbi:MAG: DUF6171 family protein, partial [Treponema sp.]|nr:DUF6171 family protein [Treponema sp.]
APVPSSLRAGAGLYRRRLERCGDCEALREKVLCAYCGCFVQFRAGVLKSYCPYPGGDKWLLPNLSRREELAQGSTSASIQA